MNTDAPERTAVTERIIGCAFTVANTLGSGFLEHRLLNQKVNEILKVYEMRWR